MKFVKPGERKAPAITIKPGPSRKLKPHSSHKRGPRDTGKPEIIHLKCGHVTTPSEIEVYRLWQPEPNKYWCDNCGKWIWKADPPKPVVYPDKPMF